ncbi:AI-2E family transporter [Cellulomonas soli]|uniref:AI-2E family transporter n=1 Tax=Cellulomonas soli TaxID=931535 RepID=UPI003F84A919
MIRRTTPPTTWDTSRPPAWLPRALLYVVLATFAGILAWRALSMLTTVTTIVVISWFLALAMEPLIAWLVRRGVRRTRATGIVMIGSIVVILGLLGLFGGLFVTQLIELVQSLPRFYTQLTDLADTRFGLDLPTQVELLDRLGENWQDLAPGIVGVGTSVLGGLFTTTAVLLVVYYMASAGPKFRAAICRYLAPHRQREVLRLWEVSQEKVADFINSRIVLAALSTAFTFVFLTILGVPYALPLAAFTGVVSQFVPTIGTYIGGALPVVVALSVSPLKGLLVLAFIVGYQQVENLVFAPKVSARSLQLNPAVSFLAVLAFGAVFGALGAFLALPVAATIQAVSNVYLRRHELVDSEMLREDSTRAPEEGTAEDTEEDVPAGNDPAVTAPSPTAGATDTAGAPEGTQTDQP